MEKISRTKIVDLLKREDFGAMVNVKGWVRTRRGSKQVNFIALNDGSTINNVQIVVDLANFDEEMLKDITTGACLSVNGVLTESVGSGQKAEIQAREIEVLGTCDNTYPLQKKGHSMEFLREIAHLRPRTNTFGAVFRIRHNMAIAIHEFFHKKGFFYFHTPIITGSDCEGAGQMFQVTTMNLYDLKKDENGSIIYDDDFFGKQASLTVSGQLEGELAATALVLSIRSDPRSARKTPILPVIWRSSGWLSRKLRSMILPITWIWRKNSSNSVCSGPWTTVPMM